MTATSMQHDASDLAAKAHDHLWMHFTRLSSYADTPVPTIVRGENLCVAAMKGCTRHIFHFDTQGHRLIADIQIKLG